MRSLPLFGALTFFLTLGSVDGQGIALPKPETENPLPSADVSQTPASSAPQLIPLPAEPQSPLPLPIAPTLPQLDEAFKQTPLSALSEDNKHHVEWRELRNRIRADPEIKAALAATATARTDLEKRKRLAFYYDLSFHKMVELASTSEMKAYLTARKNEQLAALAQPRVRPTPTPSPSPPPVAIPTTSPKSSPSAKPRASNPVLR